MTALEIIVLVVSLLVMTLIMNAVVRSIVVPRGEKLLLSNLFLYTLLGVFRIVVRFVKTHKRRDEIFARIGPTAMLILPIFGIIGTIFCFSGVFWSLGLQPYTEALSLSGSSITTLGFIAAPDNITLAFSVAEAIIGLGLVALVFGYLPTIYTVFRNREVRVSSWSNRAGSPPDVQGFLIFAHQINLLGEMEKEWYLWENWFEEIEESHLSYPMLNFFRSPYPYDSWLLTAKSVLDTAAFIEAAIDIPPSIDAQLCLKSGYQTLQRIAEYFGIEHPTEPKAGDPIIYSKEEFISIFEELEKQGVPLKDREQAWEDFAGWRVNYDAALVGLEKIINAYI